MHHKIFETHPNGRKTPNVHLVIEQPLVCLCCPQPAVAMVTVHEVSAADQRGGSVD